MYLVQENSAGLYNPACQPGPILLLNDELREVSLKWTNAVFLWNFITGLEA